MRAAVAANSNYLPVLFVHMGAPDAGAGFFADMWPQARAIADAPGLPLYRAFGLEKGTPAQMMNLSVIACSVRAIGKGNIPGKPVGDPLQMPGLFLVQGRRVLWQRDYKHAGDSPVWADLPAQWLLNV